MDNSLITTDVRSGVGSEKREPSEWSGMKSRVVVENFRQLSADLERRRIRRFNHHVEEEQKVRKELDELQKDRLRFEREKQLRKRSGLRLRKAKEHSSQTGRSKLPMNKNAFGASASLAFDPSVEKYKRRRTKTEPMTYKAALRRANKNDASDDGPRVFPYIDESDVQRFHKLCKSAAESQCRRWGAAWLYAKKEQAAIPNQHKRWKTLMLNAEKEKQRLLEERWALSAVNRKTTNEAHGTGNTIRRSSFKGVIGGSKAVFLFDDEVKQPLKSKTAKQKGPSSAKKPTCSQHSHHSSKNSQTDATLDSKPCTKLLPSDVTRHVLGWTDVPSANNIDNNNSLHKSRAKGNCTELSILSSDTEMESMPKLNIKYEVKMVRTERNKGSGSNKSQLNLPNVIFRVLLVGNEMRKQ